MFGLLPIEGSWFLRFEKRFKEFFLKPHPFFIRIFRTTLSILRKSPLNGLYTPFGSPVPGGQKPSLPLKKEIFRKSPRPSLPLKRAPPLTPTLSPQERGRKPLLLVARNRFALRMADHQRSRQIVRDGTAWVLLACELVMGLLQLLPLLLILLLT